MRLKDYIQGDRRGKDANRLEREAMSDPFLQEALDGFDSVTGNHVQMIEQLEKKYSQPAISPQRDRKLFLYWSAAASVLLLIGFGAYFFLERAENPMTTIAMLQPIEKEIEQLIADDSIATQPAMPAPTKQSKSFELAEVMDVAEADVIVADAIIVAEMVAEEKVNDDFVESSAKVMAMKVQEQQIIPEKDEEEAVVVGYGTQRRSAVSAVSKSDVTSRPFGEKEFQKYCQQNGNKNICAGKGISVKLTFFINETGKPTGIEFKNYSCEDAKKEMENLLSSSPSWTKINRKVSMTIKW